MDEKLISLVNRVVNEVIPEANMNIAKCDENLQNCGMNSIEFISIIVALEEKLEIEIPDEYLLITQMNTVTKICNVLSEVLDET